MHILVIQCINRCCCENKKQVDEVCCVYIFDLHAHSHQQGYRYELKVVYVLLHFWRVNVQTIPGFINIQLADLPQIILRHNNITSHENTVNRQRRCLYTKSNQRHQVRPGDNSCTVQAMSLLSFFFYNKLFSIKHSTVDATTDAVA